MVTPLGRHAPDRELWDGWGRDYFSQRWIDIPFLWAESYFYRKLLDVIGFFEPGPWAGIDPFEPFKNAELPSQDRCGAVPFGVSAARVQLGHGSRSLPIDLNITTLCGVPILANSIASALLMLYVAFRVRASLRTRRTSADDPIFRMLRTGESASPSMTCCTLSSPR